MPKSPGSLVTLAKNVRPRAIQNCPRNSSYALHSSDSFGWHSDGHFCQSHSRNRVILFQCSAAPRFSSFLPVNKTMSKKKIAVVGAISLVLIVAIVVVIVVVTRDYNGIGEGDTLLYRTQVIRIRYKSMTSVVSHLSLVKTFYC